MENMKRKQNKAVQIPKLYTAQINGIGIKPA